MRKFNSFDEDCIPELVSQLKSYNEDALDMPKGLAVTLRIMKYIAVPPKVDYKVEGQYLLLIKEMFEKIIISFVQYLHHLLPHCDNVLQNKQKSWNTNTIW